MSLDARVARLETDVADIKRDVRHLTETVAEIKGRLMNMPTTFQVLTWFVGVSVGLAIGLSGLVFTIARTTAG
jgi:hypothetical protein